MVIHKKFLNANLFLIKTFLIAKFDCIIGPVYSWETPFFAKLTSFFFESTLCTIYGQIWKCANFFWRKKSLNVSNVKLLSKSFFNSLWVFLMWFCFQALIKGNPSIHLLSFYFLLLETAPKFKIFQNSLRNKKILQNWP